jgi:hypothetical protein
MEEAYVFEMTCWGGARALMSTQQDAYTDKETGGRALRKLDARKSCTHVPTNQDRASYHAQQAAYTTIGQRPTSLPN